VLIPKPGTSEQRPLSIPTVRDRIVQAATKIVIEPIFEADFLPCSFGFRPKRAQQDALQVVIDEAWKGRRWVMETDIASCFEAIPHDGLVQAVQERISDGKVIKLLRAMLRAGVMLDGAVRRSDTGTPQGGVISPLLANVYLHRLDRRWQNEGIGVLVRYADDLVVLCQTQWQAERALVVLTAMLADLGLAPKATKTRIVQLREGGEGFDFLGFSHRWVRAASQRHRHVQFLARWPSTKARQRIRDRIRELTDRSRLWLPMEDTVGAVNRALRGWANYYRYGNSARHLSQIRYYALERLALMVAKRHNRSRAYGWWAVTIQSPNHLGLISLDGIVVAPRPLRGWRDKPNAGGEGRR
jgi:RNA-directed DNA polymerase